MSDARERDEFELLTPWYVAGKLDAAERQRFERAMREDPALARSVAAAREEQMGAQSLNELLHGPSAHMSDRLLAAMASPPTRDIFSRFGARLIELIETFQPRALGAAVAAAIAVVMVGGATLGGLALRRAPAQFQTASDPSATTAAAHFIVRFAPEIAIGRMQDALVRLELTVVGGPTADGFYRLRMNGAPDAPAVARKLAELRDQNGLTALVLPATAGR